ncbi:uncharacterized protein LOC126839555 [Adelges cooleyi]|uniref:uncharacterized protein LOC126839555 n=1 Tax=Adelges cooleyi TaxID=133065 RepID=UPI00218045A6|nr:uncharacterized protein LOC126839555 [Adelges cooleyi]
MIKLRLAFLIITSCTVLYRVTCHEGVIRISEKSSKVEVKSIVPKCFMGSVDDLFKTRGPYTLKAENASIDLKTNRKIFQLIVSKILDETLGLLDKFTVLVVAMVERNKESVSLEWVLDYTELHISKLSSCLEFLFDNEADVTDALTGYIFFKDMKYIFKNIYGENYSYNNVVDMFFRIKKQQWLECVRQVPTEEAHQQLYTYVEQSLEDISKVYRHMAVKSTDWLLPECLKWRNFIESTSTTANVLKQFIDADKQNLYDQYLQIASEFDSVKVMDFYVKFGKTLDGIISQMAIDMMTSFMNLILRLIIDQSNKANNFTQISVAQQIVEHFLLSAHYFENWMSYSKRLKNSKLLHDSPAIVMLQKSVVYCQKYNSDDFPTVLVPFLFKFKKIIEKYTPGVEIDFTKIASDLKQDFFTQNNILDKMENSSKLIKTLLLDIMASST